MVKADNTDTAKLLSSQPMAYEELATRQAAVASRCSTWSAMNAQLQQMRERAANAGGQRMGGAAARTQQCLGPLATLACAAPATSVALESLLTLGSTGSRCGSGVPERPTAPFHGELSRAF